LEGETVVPDGIYIDVAAMYLRTCALTEAGELSCWGNGSHREPYPQPTLEEGPFVSLYAEYSDVCALRADGSASCSSVYSLPEWTIPPDVPLKQISMGSSSTFYSAVGLDFEGYAHPWLDFEEYFPGPVDVPFLIYAQGDGAACGITLESDIHCYGGYLDHAIP
jgi:hypothetical protein